MGITSPPHNLMLMPPMVMVNDRMPPPAGDQPAIYRKRGNARNDE
jgi:hypothetical protein